MFSIALHLQEPSCRIFLIIFLISLGIALASYGSVQFVLEGFLLALTASIVGTLRWVLTQYVLKQTTETKNRALLIVYEISPASALTLLPAVLVVEARHFSSSKFFLETDLFITSMTFIFLEGILAFLLILVEVSLVKKTSALSIGMGGNLKDMTQIVLSVIIFGDHLSPINVFGLLCTFGGLVAYTVMKHQAQQARYMPVVEEEKNGSRPVSIQEK